MPQQRLGRHEDQGLAKRPDHLATQHVEYLSTVGRLHHLNVVIGTKLKETFQACGGMLGTLPFVAMRQHQCQPTMAAPLGFARCDELVYQHLCAVDEITKLSFPDG